MYEDDDNADIYLAELPRSLAFLLFACCHPITRILSRTYTPMETLLQAPAGGTPLESPSFEGSNELNEIETIEEFLDKTAHLPAEQVVLAGWVFQGVDLSSIARDRWDRFSLQRANFWGCTFPAGVEVESVRRRGARVLEEDPSLPFKVPASINQPTNEPSSSRRSSR